MGSRDRDHVFEREIPALMRSIDAGGRLVAVTDDWLSVLGYERDEVIGKKSLEFLTVESRRYAESNALPRFWESGFARDVSYQFKKKDGEILDVLLSAITVPDLMGNRSQSIAVLSDVTGHKKEQARQKRLEPQLQLAQKLASVGIMAGGLAHDLNNLLNGILGTAEMLQRDQLLIPAGNDDAELIKTLAIRASQLVNQMLAYVGRGAFIIVPLNLSGIIREMVQLLATVISKKVTFEYDLSADLPRIKADATQVQHVVMNLIMNASDAIGSRRGSIVLRTGVMTADRSFLSETYLDNELREGNYVYLEVSDTGCGMNSATLEKLFETFFTTKARGRGLGMAVILDIVRGHGGAIKVDSEPGHGTTIRILFPYTGEQEEETGRISASSAE